MARRSTRGRPLVSNAERANNTPAQGVHGGNHEPFMTERRGFIMKERALRQIRCPVLCMRINQPNQRPPNHNHYAQHLDRSVAFSAPFAWWERRLACSLGRRALAITSDAFRHQPLCCADNASKSDRSAKTKREPVRLTVSPARAPIMKVAARHEAQSKIGEQVSCSRRRCRWPHLVPVPEVLSGSLRWAK